MELIKINFTPWYVLKADINWLMVVIIVFVVCILVYFIRNFNFRKSRGHIVVDEVDLGIGTSSIKLKYNNIDQEIAYKIWIELNTRKIGLKFDEENDVIIEVYNSWYESFVEIRDLIKELPGGQIEKNSNLVRLVIEVLNEGMRPYLTKWQARFRKWYDRAAGKEEYKDLSPQELQKKYPQYTEMISDIKEANEHMVVLQNKMGEIAFGNKY